MTITDAIHQAVLKVTASVDTGRRAARRGRDGAWVAGLDAGSDCLKGCPKGMRLIVCKERPHPGAQLRFADADGLRFLRHQHHWPEDRPAGAAAPPAARAEDRIRAACSTGLRNLPLHDAAQNQIWLEIVQIALDLLAWCRCLP